MKGYKVVCRYKRRLWSAMRHGFASELTTEYVLDARTIPKEGCGPLALFTTQAAAQDFIDTMCERDLEVWECTYTASRIRALWGPYSTRITSHWEHSTYATSVTLIRRVV